MKILITGGAGYLGSSLAPLLLEKGHRVRVLDLLKVGGRSMLGFWAHPGFEFIKGDVRDPEVRRGALDGMDGVVHLAAIVGDPACAREPEAAKSTNLEAGLALLDAAGELGVGRLVFASTCSNYGKMADPDSYVSEDSPLNPVSLYAETKVSMEKAILDKSRAPGVCATSLRFSTLYGAAPRMRFDLTVNEFIKELITKKRLVVYGEQFWRPYVHVRDAARAIAMILEAPAEKVSRDVFNVGTTPENFRKQDLIEMMLPEVPGAEVEKVEKLEDPRDYRVRFDKISERLGFTTEHTVAGGIREVAAMVRDGLLPDWDAPELKNIP